jgi:hypothetical protein
MSYKIGTKQKTYSIADLKTEESAKKTSAKDHRSNKKFQNTGVAYRYI